MTGNGGEGFLEGGRWCLLKKRAWKMYAIKIGYLSWLLEGHCVGG